MSYLLASLRGREKERALSFTTIGLVAVAIQDGIRPYLPKIMEFLKVSLPVSKDVTTKKRGPPGKYKKIFFNNNKKSEV